MNNCQSPEALYSLTPRLKMDLWRNSGHPKVPAKEHNHQVHGPPTSLQQLILQMSTLLAPTPPQRNNRNHERVFHKLFTQ